MYASHSLVTTVIGEVKMIGVGAWDFSGLALPRETTALVLLLIDLPPPSLLCQAST